MLRGEGREAELTAIARGQEAQLEALIKVLEAVIENPDIVKVPVIMVEGGTSGMEGFAAILGGASNLAQLSLISNQAQGGEGQK